MFVSRLTTNLVLRGAGHEEVVPAGNIKRLHVQIFSWGFAAEVDFWLVSEADESEDRLFAPFTGNQPIEARLTLDRTFDAVGESAEPIELEGWIEAREVHERAFAQLGGAPVLQRRYSVAFRDHATVALGLHRPVTLLADATIEDLLNQEVPPDVKLTVDWANGKVEVPVLALGLGADPNETSFFDFVNWLAKREGLGLFFDLDTHTYTLSDRKPGGGEALCLPFDDVEEVKVAFEPLARHSVQVLNGAAEAQTKRKKIENPVALREARRDVLLVTPIEKAIEARGQAEQDALPPPPPRLSVSFARYPSITMRPARLYTFDEGWSPRLFMANKRYRLCSLEIRGVAERSSASDDTGDATNAYELEVHGIFEQVEDTRFSLATHRAPLWPFFVEGQVVSEIGQEDEGTYQSYRDEQSSLDYYLVQVPLFGLKVRAAFTPRTLPGHFYFPLYRNQRVRLALDFDRADIVELLDWRPGARLPKESQGNHILLGKREGDQTSIRHVYEDSKPVLAVERTYAEDHQIIQISEGRIRLETRETKK